MSIRPRQGALWCLHTAPVLSAGWPRTMRRPARQADGCGLPARSSADFEGFPAAAQPAVWSHWHAPAGAWFPCGCHAPGPSCRVVGSGVRVLFTNSGLRCRRPVTRSSFGSDRTAPASRRPAGRFGKMPSASVRRLLSLFCRSRVFVGEVQVRPDVRVCVLKALRDLRELGAHTRQRLGAVRLWSSGLK